MPVLIADSSPLVAAALRRDRHHLVCRDLVRPAPGRMIVVPITVAVEVDYFLRSRADSQTARGFLASLGNTYQVGDVGVATLDYARALDSRYADANLGLVDCTVAAIAIDLGAAAVLTLDHAHFRLIAELECELLPAETDL